MRISALVIPVLTAVLGLSTANVSTAEAAPSGANLASPGVQSPIIAVGYYGNGCCDDCCGNYYPYYRYRNYYRPHRRYYDYGYYNYNNDYYNYTSYYNNHDYYRYRYYPYYAKRYYGGDGYYGGY